MLDLFDSLDLLLLLRIETWSANLRFLPLVEVPVFDLDLSFSLVLLMTFFFLAWTGETLFLIFIFFETGETLLFLLRIELL